MCVLFLKLLKSIGLFVNKKLGAEGEKGENLEEKPLRKGKARGKFEKGRWGTEGRQQPDAVIQ